MSEPTKVTEGPPTSAGFEEAARTTPMGVVPTYDFASADAAELWIAEGRPTLGPKPSGKTGYTTADVRAALKEET